MKLYLAHPARLRTEIREWEIKCEQAYGVELVNPFYDISRDDIEKVDRGEKGLYDNLNSKELVNRDKFWIKNTEGIVAIIDGEFAIGTILEIAYAYQIRQPVYVICPPYLAQHPWLKEYAEDIFESKEEFEDFLR